MLPGHLDDEQDRRHRGASRTGEHRPHADHTEDPGGRRVAGSHEGTEGRTERPADEQGRCEHPADETHPQGQGGRHHLGHTQHQQQRQGVASRQRPVEGGRRLPVHLWQTQENRADREPADARSRPDRNAQPLPGAGQGVEHDEAKTHEADTDAAAHDSQQRDPAQLGVAGQVQVGKRQRQRRSQQVMRQDR